MKEYIEQNEILTEFLPFEKTVGFKDKCSIRIFNDTYPLDIILKLP